LAAKVKKLIWNIAVNSGPFSSFERMCPEVLGVAGQFLSPIEKEYRSVQSLVRNLGRWNGNSVANPFEISLTTEFGSKQNWPRYFSQMIAQEVNEVI
jgi:hypothetical protein